MDLNDPRRRLQVLNSTNPSLRVATAPQQTIRIASAPQQSNTPLRVVGIDGSTPTPPPQVQHSMSPLESAYRAIQGSNEAFLGGAVKDTVNAYNFLTNGFNGDKAAQQTNEFLHNLKQTDENGNAAATTAGARDNAAFKVGQGIGSAQKVITDVATSALPGAAAEKVISGVMEAKNMLQGASTASKIARTVIPAVGGGAVSTGISQIQDPSQNLASNFGTGALIDAGTSLLGPLGSTASRILGGTKFGSFMSNTADKVKGIFGKGDVVNNIIKTDNPAAIQKALGVDNSIATYLASETNPDTVKGILQSLQVDPNIQLSDAVRAKLEEAGVSAVREKDNPYGAEYNPGDKSIDVKDQSFATDENLYHELGHHIYKTQLTPEEKALFKGDGAASKSAVGREGYTQDDVNSEDFSDYMRLALSGKIDQVPEELRPTIEKYAKVAAKDPQVISAITKQPAANIPTPTKTGIDELADTVVHIPGVGHTKITKDQAEILKDEVNNIPWSAEDRPHLTAGDKVKNTTKELTREELAQVSPNAAKALDDADAKIAKQADEVGKAQTGTADGQVAGDGETIAPEPPKMDAAHILGDTSDPDTVKAVNDFIAAIHAPEGALNQADAAINDLDKVRAKERASKIAQGDAMYEAAGGGTAGVRAKLSALKGGLSKSQYVAQNVDEATKTSLLDAVQKSDLKGYQKLNTQNALGKIWGDTDKKPTRADVFYVRKFFNDQFGEGVGDEIATGVQKALESNRNWKDVVNDIAGLPRALMATGDLSGGFRQAMPLGTRHPALWAKANVESVKWAFNPGKYDQAMKDIANSPNHDFIADKLGIDLTGVGATQDEAFISAGLAEKIPVAGQIVKGADRAYTGVLTKLRYDVANQMIEKAGGLEKYTKSMEELYGDQADKALRAYGEVVNTFTGRGGQKGGLLDRHMQTASTVLFAPRLWAANIQRLNPVFYARLAKSNPQAAKLALQSQGTFLLMAGTVLSLAAASGAEVGTDPRSADFGKIKVGNTRYDILGGQQQNIVQIARQITGEKVDSTTGEVDTLGDDFGAKTRGDLIFDMLNNKSNPLLGFAVKLLNTGPGDGDALTRKDQYGNDFNIPTEASKLVIPLGVQGTADATNDTGDFVKGSLMNLPSFFGVGVQTYGNTATKDQGQPDSTGKLAFKGKITDDMVLDDNGKPYLDDKGRPVKVKFEKDATEIEKKALKDEKARSAKAAAFDKGLSKEDLALTKLSDDELKGYVKDGTIDQAKYDSISDLKQQKENVNGVKVDDNIKSDNARRFYEKYNSLTKEKQKAWLEEPASENSKAIASELNKSRSEGLSEFQPSQKLSKLYADYEKDVNSHPEYTLVDKRNKAKAFQISAYKLNYTQDQSDIYNEGGSSDLKTLVEEGSISKEDLEAAIKMDNELYTSGLTGSLKFSKKFRNTYGYAIPSSKYAADGGTGNGRGSGSKTHRANLAELIPGSTGASKANPAPQISAKRRTQGINFKDISAPKKSNTKKVTINL